ncbi:GUN4 domain-containing protein [Sphaerothrix gracilis]|uniref:GUN4 domain-containing protein n=1 Tax=Sphaerothrix gracilis TaxID=3151835 RepID=UPI0031FE16D3
MSETRMTADSKIYFALHLSDDTLNEGERNQQLREILEKIRLIKGIDARRPVIDAAANGHRGDIEIAELEVDRLRPLLQLLSKRLEKIPVEMRIDLWAGSTHLQTQTREAAEVSALLPLARRLLPKHLVYAGKAEAYAAGDGYTPVEEANLELLRHQLNLKPEEAQTIQAQALGPYKTLQQKQARYEQILAEEIQRQYPFSPETEAELERLQESLGLAYSDIADIREKHLSKVRTDQRQIRQLTAENAQMQGEITRLQNENTRLQTTLLQPQPVPEEDRRPVRDRYRQEFQQIIQHTLYPNDFDRGRLEQARRIWQLSTAEVEAIEEAVTDELYGSIRSSKDVDYRRLRQLLWSQQWQEADRETERVMLRAGSQDMRPLSSSLINSFPCLDLTTVDGLWQRYSSSRYGFQVQRQIYANQPSSQDFLRVVGWQDNWGWGSFLKITKAYSELQFTDAAPRGHLPTWRWACTTLESVYSIGSAEIDAFFDRLAQCLPS